jgi:hypothetical protein
MLEQWKGVYFNLCGTLVKMKQISAHVKYHCLTNIYFIVYDSLVISRKITDKLILQEVSLVLFKEAKSVSFEIFTLWCITEIK